MLLLCEDLSPHRIGILFLIQCLVHNPTPGSLLLVFQFLDNDQSQLSASDSVTLVPLATDLLDLVTTTHIRNQLIARLLSVVSVEGLDHQIEVAFSLIVDASQIYLKGPGQVASNSLVGQYIASIYHAYKVLKFDEIMLLFEAFVQYCKPLAPQPVENPDPLFAKFTANLVSLGIAPEKPQVVVPVAKHDFEKLVNNQICLLEKHGTPTPKLLRSVMRQMANPEVALFENAKFLKVPQYYYLGYLEALLIMDYDQAQQLLHQYFDYMVANNSKHYYHFALISKALLHEEYGEDIQAMNTIEEAISVARENKDNHALTYILLWLYNFMKNKPDLWRHQSFYNHANDQQLLEVLLKKLKQEISMHAMAYNFQVALNLALGVTRDYMELLLKLLFVSLHAKDNQPTFKLMEMGMSIWMRVGYLDVALVYCQLAQGTATTNAGHVAVSCRDAYFKFYRGDSDAALEQLKQVQALVSDHRLINSVQIRRLLLGIDVYLHKGRVRMAREMFNRLSASIIHDAELENETFISGVKVLVAEGNHADAITSIANKLHHVENNYVSIVLQLIRAEIYTLTKCYAKGITQLCHLIGIAKQSGFLPLMARGGLILAANFTGLGYDNDAYGILSHLMPLVNSLGIVELVSQGYLELAKVGFKLYQKGEFKLGRVLKFLNLAIVGFKRQVITVKLAQCFELEKEIAETYGDDDLLEHAITGLEKLTDRIHEEKFYGYDL